MIIGGNRNTLLKNYREGMHISRKNLISGGKNKHKIEDVSVLKDLMNSKTNICNVDPDCASCVTATIHLNKAEESYKTQEGPLEMNSSTVLSTTQNKKEKKVTFDVLSTPCPCVETTEEVLGRLDSNLCSPRVKKNVLDFMTRIVDKYEDKNGAIVPSISIPTDDPSKKDVLSKTATILASNCSTEKCVLNHVTNDAYNERGVAATLEVVPLENLCTKQLKPSGPRLTNDWLSNDNIDDVLKDTIDEFPEMFVFKTTMTDFAGNGDKFLNIDKDLRLSNSYNIIPELLDKGEVNCFGCVINTDKTNNCKTGKCGTHWVCVFVDCRKNNNVPWTIEYFDSVGDPPHSEISKWQERMSNILSTYRERKGEMGGVICDVNTMQHQESNNDCGVYCLYFLRARVEGIPFSRFLNKRLPDYVMIEYRRHLFSKK